MAPIQSVLIAAISLGAESIYWGAATWRRGWQVHWGHASKNFTSGFFDPQLIYTIKFTQPP